MTTETSPPPEAPPKARGPRIAIAFGIVVAVIVIYVLSLLAVHLLAQSAPALPAVDFSKIEADDTVVEVRLEKLDTVANRLTVNVLVYPKDSLYDKNFGVLTTDAAVRLYPENDLGDLQYPVGKAPAQVSTTIVAHGDPGNWPFDSYRTEEIAADVFTGSGQSREKLLSLASTTPPTLPMSCPTCGSPCRDPRARSSSISESAWSSSLCPPWRCGWPFPWPWAGPHSCRPS